ncbi:helix-turn-helix transcriptional regulator [Celeribacter marinus]|uniref:helix-turn-helix transcriptional regulator n=1 Tax=Celeribacter marinus TaxID=1397108 RepID=UPI00317F5BD0
MTDALQTLEDTLTRATQDAKYWDVACTNVVDLFGATGALLPPSNPQFRGLWMSGTQEMKHALVEYLSSNWQLKDPREGVLTRMLEYGYASDDDVFPDRAAKANMPFYRDFLRPHNFGNVCTIRILTPNGYWPLTVHFGNDHPPLTDADVAMIKAIQPMFERATKRAAEIAHTRIHEFAQFFKGTESEVFIFDADGNHCFNANATGRRKSSDRLETLLPEEISESLNIELRDVLTSDPTMSLSKAYQFNERGHTVNVLVIQIPPSLRHFFMPFKACAIRTQCSDLSALKQRRLREQFDLTETEITTVDLLASGKTPAMIADIMSLKPNSIRQRLKLIYNKANVGSQVELVGLYGQL